MALALATILLAFITPVPVAEVKAIYFEGDFSNWYSDEAPIERIVNHEGYQYWAFPFQNESFIRVNTPVWSRLTVEPAVYEALLKTWGDTQHIVGIAFDNSSNIIVAGYRRSGSLIKLEIISRNSSGSLTTLASGSWWGVSGDTVINYYALVTVQLTSNSIYVTATTDATVKKSSGAIQLSLNLTGVDTSSFTRVGVACIESDGDFYQNCVCQYFLKWGSEDNNCVKTEWAEYGADTYNYMNFKGYYTYLNGSVLKVNSPVWLWEETPSNFNHYLHFYLTCVTGSGKHQAIGYFWDYNDTHYLFVGAKVYYEGWTGVYIWWVKKSDFSISQIASDSVDYGPPDAKAGRLTIWYNGSVIRGGFSFCKNGGYDVNGFFQVEYAIDLSGKKMGIGSFIINTGWEDAYVDNLLDPSLYTPSNSDGNSDSGSLDSSLIDLLIMVLALTIFMSVIVRLCNSVWSVMRR